MGPRAEASRSRTWRLPVLLVVGMVAASLAGFYFVSQLLLPAKPSALDSAADPKSLGSADAPLEVIEYADFQ